MVVLVILVFKGNRIPPPQKKTFLSCTRFVSQVNFYTEKSHALKDNAASNQDYTFVHHTSRLS